MKETAENLLEVIKRATPALLALDNKSASQKLKPNGWSPKEVLGHMIDSTNNIQMKFVKLIETNYIVVNGYDQDQWVSIQQYQEYDRETLITVWKSFNFHKAHIIAFEPKLTLQNEIKIESAGPFTLEFIMKD